MIYIIIKNIGVNTEYCSDTNGSQEFKCVCNDGFDGKRCEFSCQNNGKSLYKIDGDGIMIWECECPFPFQGSLIF